MNDYVCFLYKEDDDYAWLFSSRETVDGDDDLIDVSEYISCNGMYGQMILSMLYPEKDFSTFDTMTEEWRKEKQKEEWTGNMVVFQIRKQKIEIKEVNDV